MIMRAAALLASLWRNVARRGRVEESLRDELDAYVHLLADEYEQAGATPAQARRRALVEAGGIEQVRDATRTAWVGDSFATGVRELRYALRTLRRSPSFLVIAVVTLAIGIGGATAVFTVINGSLLRPLPAVAEPDRLVTVDRVESAVTHAEFSYPDYRDLRDHSTSLSGLAAFNGTSMTLEDAAGSTRAWVGFVTHDFFTVLGVESAAGRMFAAADASAPGADAPQVVVLGHALWQSRFGGSQSAIGATIELAGEVFTIIGVAPPEFIGAMAVYPMELWIPVTTGGRLTPVLAGLGMDSRRQASLRLVGRLAPGRSVDDAQADLATIAARLADSYPTNRGRGVHVMPGAGITTEERADISRVPRLLAMAVTLLRAPMSPAWCSFGPRHAGVRSRRASRSARPEVRSFVRSCSKRPWSPSVPGCWAFSSRGCS